MIAEGDIPTQMIGGTACRGPGFVWISPQCEIRSHRRKSDRTDDFSLGGSLVLGFVIWLT